MTKSEQIRELAKQGLATADIARQLGIRYQHAYNVLKNSGISTQKSMRTSRVKPIIIKPMLYEKILVEAGFESHSCWIRTEKGGIELSETLPSEQGVYAFCIDGVAHTSVLQRWDWPKGYTFTKNRVPRRKVQLG